MNWLDRLNNRCGKMAQTAGHYLPLFYVFIALAILFGVLCLEILGDSIPLGTLGWKDIHETK